MAQLPTPAFCFVEITDLYAYRCTSHSSSAWRIHYAVPETKRVAMSRLYQTLKVCLVALVMVSCQSSTGTSENRLDHSANHRSSDLGMVRPASADMGDATAIGSDAIAAAYDGGVNDVDVELLDYRCSAVDGCRAHVTRWPSDESVRTKRRKMCCRGGMHSRQRMAIGLADALLVLEGNGTECRTSR